MMIGVVLLLIDSVSRLGDRDIQLALLDIAEAKFT